MTGRSRRDIIAGIRRARATCPQDHRKDRVFFAQVGTDLTGIPCALRSFQKHLVIPEITDV